MNRLAKVSLILIALLVALAIGGVVYAETPVVAPPGGSGVVLNVNGRDIPLNQGDSISSNVTRGVRHNDYCVFPVMTVTLKGSRATGVTLQTADDCTLTVSDITAADDGTTQASDPQEKHYKGWAKSELNEFLQVDLTWVHAEMEYFDNALSVYGGRNSDSWCDHVEYPFGWYIVSCPAATWWPSGRDEVYIQREGSFDHRFIPNSAHWHRAKFRGYPQDFDVECLRWGSPPGSAWRCEGDREEIDD